MVNRQFAALQPWSDFFRPSRFGIPRNPKVVVTRLLKNSEKFLSNYLCVSLVLVFYCMYASLLFPIHCIHSLRIRRVWWRANFKSHLMTWTWSFHYDMVQDMICSISTTLRYVLLLCVCLPYQPHKSAASFGAGSDRRRRLHNLRSQRPKASRCLRCFDSYNSISITVRTITQYNSIRSLPSQLCTISRLINIRYICFYYTTHTCSRCTRFVNACIQ